MSSTITVRHKFETAHRLPFLGGKCTNVHGHSWHAAWTFTGPLNPSGLVLDFGPVKALLHSWVDEFLDHGAMLGVNDKLIAAFRADGSKVYAFGADKFAEDLPWPTVEAVAVVLGRIGRVAVADLHEHRCVRVDVTETRDNTATWDAEFINAIEDAHP